MKIGDKVKLITHEKSLVPPLYVKLNSIGKILYIDEEDNTAQVKFINSDWYWVNLDCVKLIENNMQTLTRKQLITLHSQFECALWRDQIEYLLKENILEDKIDVSSKIELLKSKGTEEQKEAVKKLKITLPKSYLELHNESGLKVGDKVKVVKKATSKEQGWEASWIDMDSFVGKTFKIIDDCNNQGFGLIQNDNMKWFPYFVLEKVEEKYVPYTFEDAEKLIGKVVKHKTKPFVCIITALYKDGFLTTDFKESYEKLLEFWTELDGSPLGKLTEIN